MNPPNKLNRHYLEYPKWIYLSINVCELWQSTIIVSLVSPEIRSIIIYLLFSIIVQNSSDDICEHKLFLIWQMIVLISFIV